MTSPFAEERWIRIAELVRSTGRVRVVDLVDLLGVTEATLRKDLSELERQRLLRRTHGGAIAIEPRHEPSLDDRQGKAAAAKERIALACCGEVVDGDSVFIDTGTTTSRIAAHLSARNVNVLTNSLMVARNLAERTVPGLRHTLLGGQLRPLGGSLVGPVTLDTLARFTVNTAFISASGLSADGISVADISEAQVKQAAIERARQVIVALDATKFGRTDFVSVCPLKRIDKLITDQTSPDVASWCSTNNITLVVAQ